MTPHLFQPVRLRELGMDNRIVVAPMAQYAAEDGAMSDWHLMHLGHLCLGGAGLLFTESVVVSREARISHHCACLCDDATEAAMERVVGFCRRHGGARLGIQIGHAGPKGSADTPWNGRRPYAPSEGAWPLVAPSPLPHDAGWPVPAQLDEGGMAEIRRQFAETTARAARIGFDLAEMHAAHGYLLNAFLSPLTNRRRDGYGGDIGNRMRFPLEVFEAMRAAFPPERPLGVRISATDWVEGGWTVEDSTVFARELKGLGCDFVDVSSGGVSPRQQVPAAPLYQVPLAARVRAGAGLPVMAVGLIREPADAEAILARGEADFIALGRGMLHDPRWAWHAAEALGAEAAYPIRYDRARPARPLQREDRTCSPSAPSIT
jgi:NADPH2 dehydrogenase